ncbi:TspO/MBR family protein [Legionella sp. 16cNR16C]|uniref:TspO/MBR family protein n=1 Tax=Legionella sp. 16cNR16C TaxID=2905656 RepID=UPI00351CB7E8
MSWRRNLTVNNLLKLLIWILIFQLIGFSLGLLTQSNLHPWYENLDKSALTPPGFIFSIVWTILYGILAFIAWTLWNKEKHIYPNSFRCLFAFQMIINWLWTPFFFQFHYLIFSAFLLMILTILNLILMVKIRTRNRLVFSLLVPYITWLVFAFYLNAVIALHN